MAEQELGSGVSTPKKAWLCLVADLISVEFQKVNERDDEGGQGCFLSTGNHPPCSCKDGVRWFRGRVPNTERCLGDSVLSFIVEP